jgi:ABC-type glycerol-3-phosphate transport system substrate-binding protein
MSRPISSVSRRTLIKGAAATAATGSIMLSWPGMPTRAQSETELIVSAQEFSHEPLQPFIEEFRAATGINVTFFANPAAGGEQVAQLTPQFAAESTPIDVVSSSDEAAPAFIRAGWMEPLNDIIPEGFWDDWDQSVRDYVDIWSTLEDQVYRIPHGWSVGYFWTRKDLLTEWGMNSPATWDDIRAIGEAAKAQGMFAFADAASRPSLAFVYAAYVVAQAGGNIFDFDEGTREAFAFARELVDSGYFPPAAANWTYDQLNAAYMGDQLVTMREWSFFYDVARDNTEWFTEDKVTIELPPGGPNGERATWAGAWGWMIPQFTEKKDAAREWIKYISAPEQAGRLGEVMSDYITPRTSVYEHLGDTGLVANLKAYSEAGVIKPRPFHPQVNEAQSIIDTYFNGLLAGEYDVDSAIEGASEEFESLEV